MTPTKLPPGLPGRFIAVSQEIAVRFLICSTPVEVGCLADPRLSADLCHRNPGFTLLDDERLLRVRELRFSYPAVSAQPDSGLPETLSNNDPVSWGAEQTDTDNAQKPIHRETDHRDPG